MEKVDTDVDDTEYEIMSMIQQKMLKLSCTNGQEQLKKIKMSLFY